MPVRVWLLCLLLCLAALADATVVRNNGAEVVIGQGVQQGVRPGSRFVVVRDGVPVGELEVTLVDENEAISRLVNGEARPGDAIRANAAIPSTGTGGPPNQSLPETAYSAEQAENYENRWKETARSHSRTQTFEAVNQQARTDSGTDMMMWMNIATLGLTSFGPGGFMGSPQVIAMTASDMIGQNVWMGNYYQDAKVEITVTSWDSQMVDSYSDYTAYKESRGNLGQMAALKQIIVSQKGVDQNQVFEVRIRNTGPVICQLSPFNFHMFLLVDDRRVQCDRYDQILDKALNPGEETVGQVFFPRLSGGSDARVSLDDILGNHEDFTLGR